MKLLVMFLLISVSSYSQLKETAEFSMMLPADLYEDIEVVPIGDFVYLINLQTEIFKRDAIVSVSKLNQDLKVTWSSVVPIPFGFSSVGFIVADGYVNYLFREADSKKLKLVRIDVNDGSWKIHDIRLLTNLEAFRFSFLNDKILIYGQYNFRPVVELHDVEDKIQKVLPEIYFKGDEISSLHVNPLREEIYVVTTKRSKCNSIIKVYNEQGKYLFKKELGNKKQKIQDVELRTNQLGEPFLMGTYGSGCGVVSTGFYFTSFDNTSEIKYFPYYSLDSYGDILSHGAKEKRLKRLESGDYRSGSGRVIFSVFNASRNNFLFCMETYSVSTATHANRYVTSIDGPTISLQQYNISKSILAEVGTDGRLYASNTAKIDNFVISKLKPTVAYLFDGNSYYSLLPKEKFIAIDDFKGGNVKRHELFDNSKNRFSNYNYELKNLDIRNVIAFGSTDVTNELGYAVGELYFIKKLELDVNHP